MGMLTQEAIRAEIEARLPGWRFDEGALRKRFTFRGFSAAIAFIDRMAEVAMASRHHPDFSCHYDTVDVFVTTHSAGGVTGADLSLARAIEAVSDAQPPASAGPEHPER
jgi:4a-hydroxytetrahydrobiopterin dehydratase